MYEELVLPNGAYSDELVLIHDGVNYFDEALAKKLALFFRGALVVDLGCGIGYYVAYLRQRGIACDGFDGTPGIEKISGGLVKNMDLALKQDFPQPYDWVLSLEVGEHIPARYEDNFIANLNRANRCGLVVSWAIREGGIGHVNCRSNDWVKDKFAALNYQNWPHTERWLRGHNHLDWFAESIMVFGRV